MTRAASCLWLLGLWFAGCGGTASTPDAARGDDADVSRDAGPGVPCTAASECDDALFCNGAETCVEGLCQAGSPPVCDDGIECTRDLCSDARGACRFTVPDADGDGAGSAACVDAAGAPLGQDCDDADMTRFPGAVEVCDVANVDEDCDPSTFGFRDGDGDGAPDDRCCNVSPTGARVCGSDCDDTQAGTNLRVPEVCNGRDDDCDGRVDDIVDGIVFCEAGQTNPASCTTAGAGLPGSQVCAADCRAWTPCVAPEACNGYDDDGDGVDDDGFACVLNATEVCVSACGTAGVRTCGPECDGFGACRAPEACNFCDDDGVNGFLGERALAIESEDWRMFRRTPSPAPEITERVVGDHASFDYLFASPNADRVARLLDGTSAEQAGAYWLELQRYQGWGPTTLVVEMRVRSTDGGEPMGGWAVVVGTGGTGDLGTPAARGVPSTRTGAHVDWFWGSPGSTGSSGSTGIPGPTDRIAYTAFGSLRWRGPLFVSGGAVGVPVVTAAFDAGQTTALSQVMIITYQPEIPSTSTREERVTIALPGPVCTADADCTSGVPCAALVTNAPTRYCGTVAHSSYAPDALPDTDDPNDDVPIGSRLSIGITAGNFAQTFRPPGASWDVTNSASVVADVLLYREFVGSDPIIPISAIRRAGLCPGEY